MECVGRGACGTWSVWDVAWNGYGVEGMWSGRDMEGSVFSYLGAVGIARRRFLLEVSARSGLMAGVAAGGSVSGSLTRWSEASSEAISS